MFITIPRSLGPAKITQTENVFLFENRLEIPINLIIKYINPDSDAEGTVIELNRDDEYGLVENPDDFETCDKENKDVYFRLNFGDKASYKTKKNYACIYLKREDETFIDKRPHVIELGERNQRYFVLHAHDFQNDLPLVRRNDAVFHKFSDIPELS